jgi:hypothetical protein
VAVAVCTILFGASTTAQWLNSKTPGIPRTANGKPDLTAPPLRTADGKPDLSGIWQGPGANNPSTAVYIGDIAADLKPGEVRDWAEALYQQRALNLSKDSPLAHCLPAPPLYYHLTGLLRIVQTPGLIVFLFEGFSTNNISRIIFTDGRELPRDPNPTWFGYSVGHWEGERLVVETTGFSDQGWLDTGGHPQTAALRITERFQRRDFGHMDFEMTIDDPKTFTRPFTLKFDKTLAADTELLESVCENERIAPHLVGGAGIQLDQEVISKYAGTYEFAPGREAVVAAAGSVLRVEHLTNAPKEILVPQSETIFVGRANGNQVEFVTDSKGTVTHFILRVPGAAERKAIRKGDVQ